MNPVNGRNGTLDGTIDPRSVQKSVMEPHPESAESMNIDVAIRGARGHYAVPRVLHRAGMLKTFYTDAYIGNKPLLRKVINYLPAVVSPAAVQRLAARFAPELPRSKVVSFDRLGFRTRWRPRGRQSAAAVFADKAQHNREFGLAVVRHGFRGAQAVYAINGGALEIFAEARRHGMACILEQVSAPARVYERLVLEEVSAWPGWEPALELGYHNGPLIEREEAEWPLADLIVPASNYVAQEVQSQGVPVGRIQVVPLGTDTRIFRPPDCRDHHRGLNVLFAGYVSLRKGIPYLLQALRLLNTPQIHCRLVGSVEIEPQPLSAYNKWAELLGPVPRPEMLAQYQWADVLVFPSICEGFGFVACEAFACGVPVISTPNSGSIVTHGSDGFIVPLRDPRAIATRLEQLARDRELLRFMSCNAFRRSQDFGLETYGARVVSVIKSLLS